MAYCFRSIERWYVLKDDEFGHCPKDTVLKNDPVGSCEAEGENEKAQLWSTGSSPSPDVEKAFKNDSDDHVIAEDNIVFLDMVKNVVEKKGTVTFATWYDIKGRDTNEYTFGELWEEAGLISHYIRTKWGAQKGDRVVLCYDFGLHFFASFLGCLRAGVTAVLVYPPGPPLAKSLSKMMKVVQDCEPVLILTDSRVNTLRKLDMKNPLSKSRKMWPKNVSWKVTEKLSASARAPPSFDEESISNDDLAFLQYTSGSTGDPKGVMVSFSALAANVKLIHNGFYKCYVEDGGIPEEIVGFSWLPQYHDLGLIYAAISPFAAGWRMHMMSPITFIQKPLLWMDLMSRLHVSWGVAPDFAYHLVARKFKEERDRKGGTNPIPGLDLSSIHNLQNGTEPVRLTTREMFTELFGPHGLRDNWFHAGYGLAEDVVGVCWLHEYQPSTPRDDKESSIVASGAKRTFDPSLTLKIVDPQTRREVDDGVTGEIWISGGSVTLGYYNRPQLTKEMFHATLENDSSQQNYLRTGDLAFFQNDYLYICGRIKDLIISNGVNYFPQDIEYVVQDASPAVRPGCVAAFAREDVGNDGELEIVFEIRQAHVPDASKICDAVHSSVIQNIGLTPSRVVAIAERTICKTTSGKIQRKANRAKLHEGKHRVIFDMNSSEIVHAVHDNLDMSPKTTDEKCDDSGRLNSIMTRFFGANYDPDKTWEELGSSSMIAVELRNSISDSLAVTLPSDCFEMHRTPSSLTSFIFDSEGKALPVKLSNLQRRKSVNVSWLGLGAIQVFGVALLLMLFSTSIIPAYYVGKLVSGWVWLPFVIPTFMMSFSLTAILIKWAVVWRYQEEQISCQSIAYIRWWFVDRLLDTWENWVGYFIKGTPLLWLFYRLMGAKIHPSAQLNEFIREFDLVEIGKSATIDHHIRCRRFGPWQGETGPSLRFRRICVGEFSSIEGMLCPGATIGKGVTVQQLSVVPEGAHAEDSTIISGNPGFNSGKASQPAGCCWIRLGTIKVLWLFAELYMFAALAMVAQMCLRDLESSRWRHAPLCFWFLLIGIYSVLALVLVVVLKWLLIGRRKSGQQTSSLRTAADWVVDYHYRVSMFALFSVSFNSKIWNGFLMILGMDVDFDSKIYADSFPPSKVDLVSVKRSFLSTVTLGTKKNGCYHHTYVENSSVGIFVCTEPGVRLSRAVIEPFSHVTKDVVREEHDERATPPTRLSMIKCEVAIGILYVVQLFLIFASLIPAYETWMTLLSPSSVEIAAPVLALALTVQTVSWVLYLALLQFVTYGISKKRTRPWNEPLYAVLLTIQYSVQVYSFLPLLWGTPLFNLVARILGTNVEGRMLFYGRIYDFPYIKFEDKTVLDSALASGHIVVYGEATLGPSRVAGILHEGTHTFPNAIVTEEESGPWRAVFASQVAETTKDIESLEEVMEEDAQAPGDIQGWKKAKPRNLTRKLTCP